MISMYPDDLRRSLIDAELDQHRQLAEQRRLVRRLRRRRRARSRRRRSG